MSDYIVHKAVEADALGARTRNTLNSTLQDWVISPKYDGCHAVLAFSDGQFIAAYSRSGELVRSLNHIGRDLPKHYPGIANGLWAVCGEAWNPNEEFNVISGQFRKQDPDRASLYFVPFDVVPFRSADETFSGAPILLNPVGGGPGYLKRITALRDSWVDTASQVIRPQFNLLANATLDAAVRHTEDYARRLKELGTYDGAMLAQASGTYSVGAGKGGEFIKLKPTLSFTVTVDGAELANGDKTGKNTAALTFYLDGAKQRVSTGLTQEQVNDIHAKGWKGKRIEVEAMGLTVNGLLREPRFKGIRTDA